MYKSLILNFENVMDFFFGIENLVSIISQVQVCKLLIITMFSFQIYIFVLDIDIFNLCLFYWRKLKHRNKACFFFINKMLKSLNHKFESAMQ